MISTWALILLFFHLLYWRRLLFVLLLFLFILNISLLFPAKNHLTTPPKSTQITNDVLQSNAQFRLIVKRQLIECRYKFMDILKTNGCDYVSVFETYAPWYIVSQNLVWKCIPDINQSNSSMKNLLSEQRKMRHDLKSE